MKAIATSVIIEGICRKDNELIKKIYEVYFRDIRFYILNNSGSQADAEDVFQETLVVIYRNAMDGKLGQLVEFNAYLYTIAKYIWLKKLRDNPGDRLMSLEDRKIDIPEDDVPVSEVEKTMRLGIFQKHFLALDEACQKILKLYFGKVPMKEIAKIMGFRNEEYARRKKYLCQKSLTDRVRSDPSYVE